MCFTMTNSVMLGGVHIATQRRGRCRHVMACRGHVTLICSTQTRGWIATTERATGSRPMQIK